jgi:hypothetical protein
MRTPSIVPHDAERDTYLVLDEFGGRLGCAWRETDAESVETTMRKPRDFDAELKALGDKARDLKSRKVNQLGELVIATEADSLSADELAGALIMLAETKDTARKEAWAKRGAAFFQSRTRRTTPAAERHYWGRSGATGRRAIVNRQQGRGMTCARGRSSAASARST